MPADGSPRILITRLSHIGDCVLTLPLLCALRRKYPDAFIAWAVEKPADQLLADHPDLDELVTIPRGWLRSPTSILRLRSKLRAQRFDLVFDPQSLTKSASLGWLSRAPVRIGMARPFGREAAPWLNSRIIEPLSTHLVDRTMDLLRGIEVRDTPVDFRLPIDPAALEYVLSNMPVDCSTRFIAINPGGTWRSKQWELDRYAAVAKFARDQLGLGTLVTWAGESERAMADRIASLSQESAVVAPPTNLKQLAALFSRAQMYLGGDTGPMHIAAAVQAPCVALFGPTRPVDSGPYGPGHIALQAWYQSGSCRERRGADNLAMRDIRVDEVCSAIEQIARRSADRLRAVA